jgi:tetratricopeptide (TPR) repeat protein
MLLAPEQTLREGRYRLERRRGVGGMASVWLAHDVRLDRPVAIKVLSETLAADEEFVERFRREARVAAQLSHPNLVHLYDFGTEDERPFLVSEWIDGPDLHELRRSATPIDAEALAADLLSALDYIHRAGIVHRDVKPSNVLVGRDGRARLTDFGIAQPEDATRLTETGMVMGTISYIAPEVMRGERASARSDLYAAGVVLQQEVGATSPPGLRRLVDWLTAQEPGARPRSAAEALELVEEVRRTPTRRTAATLPLEASGAARTETSETPARPAPEPATPAPGPARPAPFEFRPEPYRRSRLGPRILGVLGAALALGALAVLVIAIAGGGGEEEPVGPQEPPVAGAGGDGGSEEAPSSEEGPAPTEEPATAAEAGVPPPKPNADPAKGAALNDKGYAQIQADEYDSAVTTLESAVENFPEESRSGTPYAFALYNLGWALVEAGQPEEAIPILEARLEIPNQTATVQAKLQEAREAAGQ